MSSYFGQEMILIHDSTADKVNRSHSGGFFTYFVSSFI